MKTVDIGADVGLPVAQTGRPPASLTFYALSHPATPVPTRTQNGLPPRVDDFWYHLRTVLDLTYGQDRIVAHIIRQIEWQRECLHMRLQAAIDPEEMKAICAELAQWRRRVDLRLCRVLTPTQFRVWRARRDLRLGSRAA